MPRRHHPAPGCPQPRCSLLFARAQPCIHQPPANLGNTAGPRLAGVQVHSTSPGCPPAPTHSLPTAALEKYLRIGIPRSLGLYTNDPGLENAYSTPAFQGLADDSNGQALMEQIGYAAQDARDYGQVVSMPALRPPSAWLPRVGRAPQGHLPEISAETHGMLLAGTLAA